MADEPPRHHAPTLVQFPPIPLLSGNTFQDEEQGMHFIDSATITLTGTDGTRLDITLIHRFGGWWAQEPPAPA